MFPDRYKAVGSLPYKLRMIDEMTKRVKYGSTS